MSSDMITPGTTKGTGNSLGTYSFLSSIIFLVGGIILTIKGMDLGFILILIFLLINLKGCLF